MNSVRKTPMTVTEVAAHLRLSTRTLQRMRMRQEGPRAITVSPKRVIYLKEDVEAWLENKVAATAPQLTKA